MSSALGEQLDSVTVPAQQGGSGFVKKGQTLRIVDIEGQQIADFVAIKENEPTEFLDCLYTNWQLGRYLWNEGDCVYTNHMNALWTITDDKIGNHYTGGGFCSRDACKLYLNDDGPGCRDTIQAEFEKHGLDPNLLQSVSCFNVFMVVNYTADGDWTIGAPLTKAGDYIDIRAEMDLMWAVSVCAWPEVANGPEPTPMRFETYAAA